MLPITPAVILRFRLVREGVPEKLTKEESRRLLTNRIYRGEMPCGKNSYLAEHPATVDEALFKRVAEKLAHGRDHGPARDRNSFA